MAPMTRSNALVPLADGPVRTQNFREASWQFIPSEPSRSERGLSEEPPSSYGEGGDLRSELEEEQRGYEFQKHQALESPEDTEESLHPLRDAANRVGREVERFAMALDRYNPQMASGPDEKFEMAMELLEEYHEIAIDTVNKLREIHGPERRRQENGGSRKRIEGASSTSDDDDDEMDIEDSETSPSPPVEHTTTTDDLERWEQEAQTWDLLKRLVVLRHPAAGVDGPTPNRGEEIPIHQYSSERDVWDNFLNADGLALERHTVLAWLKDTADEVGEDIDVLVHDLQQNADRGDIIAHGWIHTQTAIKANKIANGMKQAVEVPGLADQNKWLNKVKEPLVTQLDPDVMTRQNRKLQPQDGFFERAIWLGCYEMLRRGKSAAEIQAWCANRTEVWRAISMSGFPDDKATDDEADDSGNPDSNALWRQMCFELARKGGHDDYERAVYGILCGDVPSVEPVCKSWDDLLFAHYNNLLRAQFDAYVRAVKPPVTNPYTSKSGSSEAVQFQGEQHTASKRIIENLQSDPRANGAMGKPMKMLQGVLIADQFPHFIFQQGLALSKSANAKSVSNLIPPTKTHPEDEGAWNYINPEDKDYHDSMRVLAHFVIIFMGLGVSLGGAFRETEVENVIVVYTQFLRLSGKEELIPLYCSQLTGKRKYAVLCRSLIDIEDKEQRITQIRLIRELGLDVQEFVNYQARFLLNDHQDTTIGWPAAKSFNLFTQQDLKGQPLRVVKRDFIEDDTAKLERTDILLIRSLEWYLLVDGLWSETFRFGTMLYMRFFKHGHLQALRTLAAKVPSNVIAFTKTRAILGENLKFEGLEQNEEDLTEVLDGSGENKRLLKQHLLAEALSYRELEALVECLDNIETISSIWGLLLEDDGNGWQKKWRKDLIEAFGPLEASVQPLLRGWLLKSQQAGFTAEFKLLRETYLPETLLAYISILRFAGQVLTREYLLKCMEFSALVAEDGSDLCDLFQKTGRMQDLVEILAGASKSLLITTSMKAPGSSQSKKLRARGWTYELWNVKAEDKTP